MNVRNLSLMYNRLKQGNMRFGPHSERWTSRWDLQALSPTLIIDKKERISLGHSLLVSDARVRALVGLHIESRKGGSHQVAFSTARLSCSKTLTDLGGKLQNRVVKGTPSTLAALAAML